MDPAYTAAAAKGVGVGVGVGVGIERSLPPPPQAVISRVLATPKAARRSLARRPKLMWVI